MSGINGDDHRTRRRAVRSVGPPVEEAGTAATKQPPAYVAVAKPAGGAGTKAESAEVPEAAAADAATVKIAKASEKSAPEAGQTEVGLDKTASEKTASDKTAAAGTAAAGTAAAGTAAAGTAAAGTADDKAAADKTAEDDSAGDEAVGDADADAAPERSVRRILTLAAAAAVVVAMVAGAVASVFLTRAADQRDERRSEYVQTARQAVLNLTTIRADSAKEDIDRILSLASGQFKSEFDGRVDPFMSIVQQAKVVSNGEVVEAAVQSDTEDSADVLVAAKQTLTNAGQAEPQTRYYRFRVTVTRSDSGLTASKVEFVA